MKRYFQQICYQFRTQPVILIISVVGTALSIAFVMLFLQKRQVYLTPLAPESNRERTLHIVELLSRGESPGNLDLDALMLGGGLVRECFYPLQTAEAVTAYTSVAYGQGSLFSAQAGHVSLPDGKKRQGSRMKGTDAAFWKVFDFSFIHGKPYTAAEFDAALPLAVIDEHVAYSLWGTTDVVGREFKLNYYPYRVVGVVRPVPSQAFLTESQIWVPYTTVNIYESGPYDLRGSLFVSILAKDKKDFPAIRKECKDRVQRFNEEKLAPLDWRISLHVSAGEQYLKRDQPYDQEAVSLRHLYGTTGVNKIVNGTIFFLLLLIPALNLSAMLSSRLRRQRMEIAVRRSFGSSRSRLMWEICVESFLVTLIGGIMGLLICFIILYVAPDSFLFIGEGIDLYTLVMVMFNWRIFGYTLLACIVLNLLSTGVPVWRAVHMNIVEAWGGGNR